MRKFIIAGAGGFGREVYYWLQESARHFLGEPGKDWQILGFIDDNSCALQNFSDFPPVLGRIDNYRVDVETEIVLGLGQPAVRKKIVTLLEGKGAKFYTLIHPLAHIFPTASIGNGSIIAPGALVSDQVIVGRFALVQPFATLGHDAMLGDYSELCPKVSVSGDCKIGALAFLGSNSAVAPKVCIGVGAQIAACSFVMQRVRSYSFVSGVPGRETRNFFAPIDDFIE